MGVVLTAATIGGAATAGSAAGALAPAGAAIKGYAQEVRLRAFPGPDQVYGMKLKKG